MSEQKSAFTLSLYSTCLFEFIAAPALLRMCANAMYLPSLLWALSTADLEQRIACGFVDLRTNDGDTSFTGNCISYSAAPSALFLCTHYRCE